MLGEGSQQPTASVTEWLPPPARELDPEEIDTGQAGLSALGGQGRKSGQGTEGRAPISGTAHQGASRARTDNSPAAGGNPGVPGKPGWSVPLPTALGDKGDRTSQVPFLVLMRTCAPSKSQPGSSTYRVQAMGTNSLTES